MMALGAFAKLVVGLSRFTYCRNQMTATCAVKLLPDKCQPLNAGRKVRVFHRVRRVA